MITPATILTNPGTAARTSRVGRGLRLVLFPVRRIGRWYYYLPRGIQIGLALVLVGGTVGGGIYSFYYLENRTLARKLTAASQDFQNAARVSDIDGMKTALDRILALNPNDENVRIRRQELEVGSANSDDLEIAYALMNHYLKDNLPAAAREAEKIHAHNPKDWLVILIMAHNALSVKKDPAEAGRLLDQLPDPEDKRARLETSGLVYTLRLQEVLGRDSSKLRDVIVRRVLPMLKTGRVQSADPSIKVQFIECYLEPFSDPTNHTELAGYWDSMTRLADSAVTDAAASGDAASLIRIGNLTAKMQSALTTIARVKNVPAEDVKKLSDEIDDRALRSWQSARAANPKAGEPYLGLARLYRDREKKPTEQNLAEAEKVLREGMIATDGNQAVLTALTEVLTATGNAVEAFQKTVAAARRADDDPAQSADTAGRAWKWYLVAMSARHAMVREDAMQACAFALAREPKHIPSRVLLADLWLEGGNPQEALKNLREAGEPALRSNPALARIYGKTLVECGLLNSVSTTLAEFVTAAPRSAPPRAAVELLRGAFEARTDSIPDLQLDFRAATVAALANDLLKTWPGDPAATRLRADALGRRAELSSPRWNIDLAREALRLYDSLPTEDSSGNDKENHDVAARTAVLQLKGTQDPIAAQRTIEPLLKAGIAKRSAFQAEVITAVLLANGQVTEAYDVIRPYCQLPGGAVATSSSLAQAEQILKDECYRNSRLSSPSGTAGGWVQFALALHARGRSKQGLAALDVVMEFQDHSTREHAEFNDAKSKVLREKRD